MNGKKVVAYILAFSMLMQFPDIPIRTGIQAEVEASENIQNSEEEEETPTLFEEEEEIQIPYEEDEINQTSGEEEKDSVTLMLTLEETEQAESSESSGYPFTFTDLTYSRDENKVLTIEVSAAADLIKLSHCDPSSIQYAKLNITISGSVTLTGVSVEKAGVTYSFTGIGSESFPFSGALTGQSITFGTDQPLFRAVTSSVDFNGNTIQWESTVGKNEQGLVQKPMLAEVYQFEDESRYDLSRIKIKAKSGSDVVMGPLIGEIRGKNGTLSIGNVIDYAGAEAEIVQSANAGLICNTLSNGTVVLTDQFVSPASYSVTALTGHAGGVIGEMKPVTELVLNAGLNCSTITGQGDAGAVVGHVLNAKITGSGSVNSAEVTSLNDSGSAGAIAGYMEYDAQADTESPILASFQVDNTSLAAPMAVGGLYGKIKLDSEIRAKLTLQQDVSVQKSGENVCANYGGLIGCLEGVAGDKVAILEIDGASKSIISDAGSNNTYQGGVVGCIGGEKAPVTLFAKDITVSEENPEVSGGENDDVSFGGLAGRIEAKSIAVVSGTLVISVTNVIACGGGVVGSMQPGSVLSLSGETNLSSVFYELSENVGQIAGKQESSLIFAKGSGCDAGWTYIRSSEKAKIDDIGNYGQVIRLKQSPENVSGSKLSSDLFNVKPVEEGQENSSAGKLEIKAYATNTNGNDFTISNEDDFALLSVLWQSHGNIAAGNIPDYAGLSQSTTTISLSKDIDLTGSGITGLTRDMNEVDSVFSGSFDGQGHSITLAIGEAYGCFAGENGTVQASVADDGCGRIYRHNALGLFASSSGSIYNLTIDGSIDVESYADQCYVGGIAGLIEGGSLTLSGINASEYILCGNGSTRAVFVGGLYGAVRKTSTIIFGETGNAVTSSAAIKVKDATHDGQYMCLGGLIGAVVEENATSPANQSEVTMKNVVLQGRGENELNLDGTSITDGQSFFAGGLIGAVVPYSSGKKKTLNIEQVTIDGYAVKSNNTSGDNSISGGLLGSLWASTDVTFGKADSTGDSFALCVVDGSNTANNVTYFGGLVYAASGKWTVHNHGIDLSGAKLSATAATSFGILVHDAYDGGTPILETDINRGGLYIELTSHWDNAYRLEAGEKKITITVNNSASFDEFAAYTAGSDIWLSEKNGVISLHTDDNSNDGKLLMNGTEINSYVNRSYVGEMKKTNSHSRYYYNLDRLYTEVKASSTNSNNSRIDTNAELMLWSVLRYGATNLREYFTVKDVSSNATVIGGERESLKVAFDLKGYSYYPIDLLNMDLTVQNAVFTFYNQEIENGENGRSNKNTSTKTQHEGMHCGLFRNFLRQSSVAATIQSYYLTVQTVSFSGTIGKVDNISGVLLCGEVKGNNVNEKSNVYNVVVSDVTLKNLLVNGFKKDSDKCTPLLIAKTGSFSTTSISQMKVDEYEKNVKAGTSLIGYAGNEDATQVNLSFSEMMLPSLKDDSSTIFSHASFLESFQYAVNNGVGSAVYNFTEEEKDKDKVTFGAEIDGTKEYKDQQLYYFNSATLVSDGEKTANADNPVFPEKYLPYVYMEYVPDISQSTYHEVAVNHSIVDIIEGCGTYADPYVIKNAAELNTIAEYLRSGSLRRNWKVTITSDQTVQCTRRKDNKEDNEITYICNGTQWVNQNDETEPNVSNEMMHYYLLSAYYDIQNDIILENFKGLGSKDYGFRGVITSTKSTADKLISITLKGDKTAHGLIPYSYGSVIKDLNVEYKTSNGNGLIIEYSDKNEYAPSAFFGGVFGVILGGDNIIDNVSVTMDDSFLSLTGTKPYLIQVGGYVGSISGGGVIFRNMDDKNGEGLRNGNFTGKWIPEVDKFIGEWTPEMDEETQKSLYVNPFIGRVLDGYACSEDCVVDNTDKNYKINNIGSPERIAGVLKSSGDISGEDMKGNTQGGTKIEINSSVGLWAFSSILNSGASAGPAFDVPGTSAYAGGDSSYKIGEKEYKFGNKVLGKVRCATYNQIGDPDETEDFKVAQNDDRLAPGLQSKGEQNATKIIDHLKNDSVNLCYLAARFGNKYSMFAAVAYISDVRYEFKEDTFDMTSYGNGYQGIGCRYKANAGNNQLGVANYDRVVPWIRYVKGNKAVISAKINVREYVDDDFWTMGVGGVFAYTYFYNNDNVNQTILSENDGYAVSELTIKNSTITLRYYDNNGNEEKDLSMISKERQTGVGGFSGAQVGDQKVGRVNKVQIENTIIKGGYQAGGIFGSIGKMIYSANTSGITKNAHFLATANGKSSADFFNCGYSKLVVQGFYYSGGLVGELYSSTMYTNNIKQIEASESEIRTTAAGNHQISAGGLIGKCQREELLIANIEITDTKTEAYGKIAGLIGWIQDTKLTAKNTIVKSTNSTSIKSTSSDYNTDYNTVNYSVVGGIIGRSQDSTALLSSCHVINMQLGSGKETAVGGLIGDSAVVSTTTTIKLETFDCSVENCSIQAMATSEKRCYAGGLIGLLGDTWVGSNLLFSNSEIENTQIGTKTNRGLLVGCLLNSTISNTVKFNEARVAGISIQNLKNEQLKLNEVGNLKKDELQQLLENKKGYFAYADYEENPSKQSDLLGATAVRPYVVTSPVSSLSVYKEDKQYNLFGDGASWNDSLSLKAETIWNEANNADSKLFQYTRTGLTAFDFSKRFSKYSDNQKDIDESFVSDFPVLLVSADNTKKVISDYLDLLTNGGYSQARTIAPGNVKVTTERYYWNSTSNRFEYSSERPSLRVGSDGNFTVTKEYDNDMNRFTLLTVSFEESSQIDSSESHTYKVQIPLIVRRVVEVDFTATLYYGANLNAEAYNETKYHVLDSFGNTISGYLTYCYNSAYGVPVEYGWQNFVDEGGNVAQVMEKTLVFDQMNAFPSGTQLTLIDESSGAVYYKTLGDDVKEVSMSDFKTEDGIAFASKTIGEIMSVTAEKSQDGKFIQVDKYGKPSDSTVDGSFEEPSVFVNGKYYRLAKTDGSEDTYTKYKMTVVKDSQPKENYYLVITIPQVDAKSVNGKLETKLGGEIAHHINYKLRNKYGEEDGKDRQENTASTYLISEGYQQNIEETLSSRLGVSQTVQKISGIDRKLYVAVRSKIEFPNEQIYKEYDSLYQSFTANLQTYIKEDDKTEAVKIPSQTGGKVYFYVTDESGNYYSVDGTSWKNCGTSKTAVTSYEWSSTGDSMELLFSADGSLEEMIDLQGMRDLIWDKQNPGNSHFYVEAVLEAVVPAAGLDVIPESNLEGSVPESYAMLTYVSHLSTQKESLSYSSTKSVLSNTQVKYYREKNQVNQLTYDADQIDQLGINLHDLVDEYLNQAGTCSRIETTSWYDLSGVRNLEEILRKSSGIRYTLSLRAKGTDSDYPAEHLSNGKDYMQLSPTSSTERYNEDTGTWSWIVPRDKYMDGDNIKTGTGFDGSTFVEKIPVWVRIDNVESLQHFYSNYKLELNVEVIDASGNILIGPDSDYVVYTLTKIQPEFID